MSDPEPKPKRTRKPRVRNDDRTQFKAALSYLEQFCNAELDKRDRRIAELEAELAAIV